MQLVGIAGMTALIMGLNQERSSKEQGANSKTNSVYNEAQGIEPPAQVEPSTRTNL
jgi:hypothetical protein